MRSNGLRRLMTKLPCQRCGNDDGTIVGAHYFGPRRHALGGGMGIKCTDAAMAALCSKCHTHMDSYADGNTVERSEEFLFLIVLTHHRLLERGWLTPELHQHCDIGNT